MISVVIPARNAAGTIAATLASLAPDRALIGEVILVDDSSADDTAVAASREAARHGLPLRIVAGAFGSAGAARNAGIAAVRGTHIFFIDADDELFPASLARLWRALEQKPGAGLAIGAVVRRTDGRPDKVKTPAGYTANPGDADSGENGPGENARRLLRNDLLPIAMGSALVEADAVRDLRFPTSIGLDEDTCYWAAVLTRLSVVTVSEPVLRYDLDEARMDERFIADPRAVYLGIALELGKLSAVGVRRDVVQWRKAWVALRIVRLLIMYRRYAEARDMLRLARAHRDFRRGWKCTQYSARILAGLSAQRFGLRQPSFRARKRQGALPQRTLVLTVDPAQPPVSGADLRNFQNATAMSQFGEVMIVSVNAGGPSGAAGIGTASLAREGRRRGPPLRHWRTGAEMRIPRSALRSLFRQIRSFAPDTIVVEGVALSALLPYLRPLARTLILDMHNIESHLLAQTHQPGIVERLLPAQMRAAGRVELQEKRAVAAVDRVWVCSEADRERFETLFGTRTPAAVVPNGIPRQERAPETLGSLPGPESGWPVLLFVGHLGYEPNIVAAERLARNILPAVAARLPAASLILAGRYPKPAIRQLARLPGVQLVENPGDVAPLIERAHVSVMPLAHGGGTRIKILEAMAWGLPVVATSIAAEGQGFAAGEDIVIAESDAEICDAVIALCEDRAGMDVLRQRAHTRVMQAYGRQAIDAAVRRGLGLDVAGGLPLREEPEERPAV